VDVIWNQTQMRNLLQSFFTLMKMRVGFFDLEGEEILAFPPERTDFCNLIRRGSEGEEACRRCDRAAFQKAVSRRIPYIYQCHAGLTEVIAPILSPDDKRAGYLMIGQMRRPEQGEAQWEELQQGIRRFCPDTGNLKAAYFRLVPAGMEEVRASANILQALASYVWLDNHIRIQHEPLSSRVKTHIAENLEKPLSLLGLARQFGVGKTTLCGAIKRDCGQTVNELIRTARIERARELLQAGKLSVMEIAEKVGILDYNYFTKVFKTETGVPPSVYRRLCEGGYLYQQAVTVK
jgi:AraC-like DNA-binding protein